VQLPAFVKVAGTIGQPKTETDKLVIVGLVSKVAAGIPGVVGGKAGNILQGVGGLLTGQAPAGANPSTNQLSTNKPAILNPLDFFKKKK
jgi:hypothetical protein